MSSSLYCAKVFFVCGSLFLLVGLLTRGAALPSVDIAVHATYIVVARFHLLVLSALALWIYAGLYYLGALLFGLQLNPTLTILHLAITMVGLIGLNSVAYLRATTAFGNPTPHTFASVGIIGAALFLAGMLMFVLIYLFSSGEKIWRITH